MFFGSDRIFLTLKRVQDRLQMGQLFDMHLGEPSKILYVSRQSKPFLKSLLCSHKYTSHFISDYTRSLAAALFD